MLFRPQTLAVDLRPLTPGALALPFVAARVPAGFPSPADDHVEARLSLDDLVLKNPTTTFFARAEGYSMTGAGISDGDILVIDRSVEPREGAVVVAALDGEMTVKRVRTTSSNGTRRVWLVAENDAYLPVEVSEEADLMIWGVVTHVIHAVK